MFGDIHHPQPIRCIDIEDPVYEILGKVVLWIPSRAAFRATPIDAPDARLAHQPLDPLTRAERLLAESQLRVDAW
jgi:hypothetical protein